MRIVNATVNKAGISYDFRMTEETGASVVDSTRAHIAARAIFAMGDLWAPIEALDGAVAPDVQLRMILAVRHMVERGALWLLRHRRAPLDITATVAAFSTGARELSDAIPNVLFGSDREQLEATAAAYEAAGVGHDLAWRTAALDAQLSAMDIIEVATARGASVSQAAAVFFAITDRLGVDWLRERVLALARDNEWQTLATGGAPRRPRRRAARAHCRGAAAPLGRRSGIRARRQVDRSQRPAGRALPAGARRHPRRGDVRPHHPLGRCPRAPELDHNRPTGRMTAVIDLETFRSDARSWLAAHKHLAPRDYGAIIPHELVDAGIAWQRLLFADGWAGIHWPVEHGGRGLTPEHNATWIEECARAGVPPFINMVGIVLAGTVIQKFGTDEQKAEHLRATLAAEQVWCQLFSEPGAGQRPRLAGDASRARRRAMDRQRPEGVDAAEVATPTGASSWPAPTPTRRSTRASRSS